MCRFLAYIRLTRSEHYETCRDMFRLKQKRPVAYELGELMTFVLSNNSDDFDFY